MREKSFTFWPKDLPRTLSYPEIGFDRNLSVWAQRCPERTFVNFYGFQLSWRKRIAQVAAVAGYLQRRCGVVRGTVCCCFFKTARSSFLPSTASCARAGWWSPSIL